MIIKSKQRKTVGRLEQTIDEEPEDIKLSSKGKKVLAMIELSLSVGTIIGFILIRQPIVVYTWMIICVYILALCVSYLIGRIVSKKTFLRLGNWSLRIYLAYVGMTIVFAVVACCCGIEPYAERIKTFLGL